MSNLLETVGPRSGGAPLTYTLTETGTVDLQSAFAHFDGTSASGAWRPTLTIRAQNGTILSRTFPTETLATGDTADVTFAPFLRSAATTRTESAYMRASIAPFTTYNPAIDGGAPPLLVDWTVGGITFDAMTNTFTFPARDAVYVVLVTGWAQIASAPPYSLTMDFTTPTELLEQQLSAESGGVEQGALPLSIAAQFEVTIANGLTCSLTFTPEDWSISGLKVSFALVSLL